MSAQHLSSAEKSQVLADALPFIRSFHGKTFVIKYGGNAMTEPALKAGFARDIAMLKLVGMNPIVVHGGGPQINELLDKMGIQSEFRRGMRVTDAKTLHVVEMVLGELNQEIVSLINQHGGKAVGLNGSDAHFIQARKMLLPPAEGETDGVDIGFVGDILSIDTSLIKLLHSSNFIPVIMPIGIGEDGSAYNINADVVAGKLAETLAAEKLILMTNTRGLLDKQGELISSISLQEIDELIADGTIHGGMIPKIESALVAVRNGVKSAYITDGRVPNSLMLEVLTSEGVGTMIRPNQGPHFLADAERYLNTPEL